MLAIFPAGDGKILSFFNRVTSINTRYLLHWVQNHLGQFSLPDHRETTRRICVLKFASVKFSEMRLWLIFLSYWLFSKPKYKKKKRIKLYFTFLYILPKVGYNKFYSSDSNFVFNKDLFIWFYQHANSITWINGFRKIFPFSTWKFTGKTLQSIFTFFISLAQA